jgi:hypothetical protein
MRARPLNNEFDLRELIMTDLDNIRLHRAELKHQYGVAYEQLSNILFTVDPIGINFEENTDEYEPEVGTILPRLRNCLSADDVRQVLYEEFVKWFDVATAGPPENYQAAANQTWEDVLPGLAK